jgi:hypothetical protein
LAVAWSKLLDRIPSGPSTARCIHAANGSSAARSIASCAIV